MQNMRKRLRGNNHPGSRRNQISLTLKKLGEFLHLIHTNYANTKTSFDQTQKTRLVAAINNLELGKLPPVLDYLNELERWVISNQLICLLTGQSSPVDADECQKLFQKWREVLTDSNKPKK